MDSREARERCEEVIKKTWAEVRTDLAKGVFKSNQTKKAMNYVFMKQYNDAFINNEHLCRIRVNQLEGEVLGRGSILRADEILNYERFIPKAEFIQKGNRFSPRGVEWLYLAIGDEDAIRRCSEQECRAGEGDRFGFCHFAFDERHLDLKLVDLTIANNFEARINPFTMALDKKSISELSFYIYTKLLSENLFLPISEIDDSAVMYAPFQMMAQYYISRGYSGIIYKSTVSEVGRNIVLFDKNIAHPIGSIEDYVYGHIQN